MTAFHPTTNGIPPIRKPATETLRWVLHRPTARSTSCAKHRTSVCSPAPSSRAYPTALAAPASRPGPAPRPVPTLRHHRIDP